MDWALEDARKKDIPEIFDLNDQAWIETYPNPEAALSLEEIKARLSKRKLPPKIVARYTTSIKTLFLFLIVC